MSILRGNRFSRTLGRVVRFFLAVRIAVWRMRHRRLIDGSKTWNPYIRVDWLSIVTKTPSSFVHDAIFNESNDAIDRQTGGTQR